MTDDVPVFEGDHVRLRTFRHSDIAERFAMGRSAEIVRGFGGNPDGMSPLGKAEAREWVERNMAAPFAWAVETEGRLLGGIRLHSLEEHDRRARLAVGFYDVEQLGRGFVREAIGLLLSYAFGELGLHRVDLRVIETNARAICCYRACGFIEEGRERESARVGATWRYDIIMGVLARDFHAAADPLYG